jgi:hypothetical protein
VFRLIAPLLALLLLAGCPQRLAGPRPAGARNAQGERGAPGPIVPQGPSLPAVTDPSLPAGDARAEVEGMRPRVAIDTQDAALQVVSANLDVDPEEEQVIAVKKRDDLEAPVRVIVVDSDPAQGQYFFQSWESETNATNARILDLAVKDIVGDHGREIIVSGMNREGRLTLDVFRPSPPPLGKGLAFRAVCQIVADEIHIEESERDDSYTYGGRNGESFPIVSYLRDPQSENVMDLIRITYSWRYAEGRFVPGPAEKIPGEKVEQKQLERLFTTGTVAAFEEFLAGSWVQLSLGSAGPERIGSIVDFQPQSRRVSISSGDTQEVYVWRDTLRTIYNRVILIGENEAVPKITKTFSIGVESVSSIAVSIQGSDLGDFPLTIYTKASDEIQSRLLSQAGAVVTLDEPAFSGAYTGASDLAIEFFNPRLAWTEGGTRREGSYVVFSLRGRRVLGVRLLSDSPHPSESRSYLADFKEKRETTRILRTLVLTPVLVTVKGFEEALGNPLTLSQTQGLPKK